MNSFASLICYLLLCLTHLSVFVYVARGFEGLKEPVETFELLERLILGQDDEEEEEEEHEEEEEEEEEES